MGRVGEEGYMSSGSVFEEGGRSDLKTILGARGCGVWCSGDGAGYGWG